MAGLTRTTIVDAKKRERKVRDTDTRKTSCVHYAKKICVYVLVKIYASYLQRYLYTLACKILESSHDFCFIYACVYICMPAYLYVCLQCTRTFHVTMSSPLPADCICICMCMYVRMYAFIQFIH